VAIIDDEATTDDSDFLLGYHYRSFCSPNIGILVVIRKGVFL
jgi:hypothetical protein